MVSKTRMLELVKAFDAAAVGAALAETPALKDVRDERGRNWLHVCCATAPKGREAASVAVADVLLANGFSIDTEAFREGEWRATPLWYAISRGRNLPLAEHLLKRGCNPNYSLWAAAWNDDAEAIRLLVAHGGDLEDTSSPDETPLVWAVKTGRFAAAAALLEAGSNVDAKDPKGRTPLHCAIHRDAPIAEIERLIRHGARGDIPDGEGRTAAAILSRKRDPALKKLAEAFG